MGENESECPICLKKLGDKNIFVTSCGHVFCGSCMIANMNFTDRCPLCRQNITDGFDGFDGLGGLGGSGRGTEGGSFLRETYDRYSGLIIENVRHMLEHHTATGGADMDFFRQELSSLLQAFQAEIERTGSGSETGTGTTTGIVYGRSFSLSDIPFDPVDEIMANMEIPE